MSEKTSVHDYLSMSVFKNNVDITKVWDLSVVFMVSSPLESWGPGDVWLGWGLSSRPCTDMALLIVNFH